MRLPHGGAGPRIQLILLRKIPFEMLAASGDAGQRALGQPPRLCRRAEIADDLLPRRLADFRVGLAVGQDLDVALAERDEEQNPARLRLRQNSFSEVEMGEALCLATFDSLRHQGEPDRLPFEDQRKHDEQCRLGKKAFGKGQPGLPRRQERRRHQCQHRRPDHRVEPIAVARRYDGEDEMNLAARRDARRRIGDALVIFGR